MRPSPVHQHAQISRIKQFRGDDYALLGSVALVPQKVFSHTVEYEVRLSLSPTLGSTRSSA
jgi:hypothetical protein